MKGGEKMSEEKIKTIAEMLSGLKRYEWSRLKIAIERMYWEMPNLYKKISH